MGKPLSDDAENIVFPDELVLDVVELDLGAAVLADQYLVSLFALKGNGVAVIVLPPGPKGHNFGFLGLFLRGVGNDNPAFDLLVIIDVLDLDASSQRSYFYFAHVPFVLGWFSFSG